MARKDLGKQPALYPMPVLIVAAYDAEGTVQAMNAAWGTSYASFADGHMFGYRDFTVNACYENMLKIAGAEEVAPIATFRDAYDVERTIEAVRNSWENRCWVKLADFT